LELWGEISGLTDGPDTGWRRLLRPCGLGVVAEGPARLLDGRRKARRAAYVQCGFDERGGRQPEL